MESSVKKEPGLQTLSAAAIVETGPAYQFTKSAAIILLAPQRVARWLVFSTLFLLVCHVFIVHVADDLLYRLKSWPHYAGYRAFYDALYQQFSLALDGNIPTYFSSLLLAMAALLLYLIYRNERQSKTHWLLLSFLFIFLSIDESTQLHEQFGGLVGNKVNTYIKEPPAFLQWAWMVPYSALTLAVGLYYLKFIWKLPAKTKKLFFLSGFVYVFAALFLEFFESHIQVTYGSGTLANAILYPVEEVLEMLGVVIFIYALLDYIKTHYRQLHIETI